MRFVAAALPKLPICGPELGDRISLTSDARGLPPGLERVRSGGAAAPPYHKRGCRPGAFLYLPLKNNLSYLIN